MRKLNSTAEFEAQRRRFLIDNFRQVIARQSRIAVEKAFLQTAAMPAPRFWVSEARAAAVVGKMMADEAYVEGMVEEKREMYREIYRRFSKIRRQCPEMTISDIVFEVVNAPAPRSYISWQRVRSIINKEKRMSRIKR